MIATHYCEIQVAYHRVPVPVLLGPSNTGKSPLAKVAGALIGRAETQTLGLHPVVALGLQDPAAPGLQA